MADKIALNPELYASYIKKLRREVNETIGNKPTDAMESTNVPTWVEYASICAEIVTTLTAIENMLIENVNDFEKAAGLIEEADEA